VKQFIYSILTFNIQFCIRLNFLLVPVPNSELDEAGIFPRAGLLFWWWACRPPFHYDAPDNGILCDADFFYLQLGRDDSQRIY